MNKLTKTILWGILIIGSLMLSLMFTEINIHKFTVYTFGTAVFRFVTVFITIFYFLEIGSYLQELINIKYRIVKEPRYKYIHRAQYLTLNTIFFPVWKPITFETHSYEAQNIFGAKWKEYYINESNFESEEDAVNAIENHKIEWKQNRQKWLEPSRKTKPIIKYL